MKNLIGILILTAFMLLVGVNLLSCRSVKVDRSVYDSTSKKDSSVKVSDKVSEVFTDNSEYEKETIIEYNGTPIDPKFWDLVDTTGFTKREPNSNYVEFATIRNLNTPKSGVLKITIREKGKKDIKEEKTQVTKTSVNVSQKEEVKKKEVVKKKTSNPIGFAVGFMITILIILGLRKLYKYIQKNKQKFNL